MTSANKVTCKQYSENVHKFMKYKVTSKQYSENVHKFMKYTGKYKLKYYFYKLN